jgi:hypothetical protein
MSVRTKPGTRIEKALTPEEQAIVGNIKSLLTQLEGSGNTLPVEMSDQPPAEDIVSKCDDPSKGGFPVKKDETENASHPQGHAEQTINELPVDDEEALSVLKSIMKSRRPPVRKAARRENDAYRLLKVLTERVNTQTDTLERVLDDIYGANRIMKAAGIQKPVPRVPVQPSSQDILAALGQLVQKSQTQETRGTPESMSDALKGIWGMGE